MCNRDHHYHHHHHHQLIPNDKGMFLQLGLDSFLGVLSLLYFFKASKVEGGARSVWAKRCERPPWKVPIKMRGRCLTLSVVLLTIYFTSSIFSSIFSAVLSVFPISDAMFVSLQVLLSHVCWVILGAKILGGQLKPGFFSKGGGWYKEEKR